LHRLSDYGSKDRHVATSTSSTASWQSDLLADLMYGTSSRWCILSLQMSCTLKPALTNIVIREVWNNDEKYLQTVDG